MKYFILGLAIFFCKSSYGDHVFIGKPIEAHIYAMPLSLQKLIDLDVPYPKLTLNQLEHSNSCGLQITTMRIKETLYGDKTEVLNVYDALGEWCKPQFTLAERKLFHLIKDVPFDFILEYEYVYDSKLGIVIPGPGKSSLQFMNVPFSKYLVRLTEPVYSRYLEIPEFWQDALNSGEISLINGGVWYNTGVAVKEVLRSKKSP